MPKQEPVRCRELFPIVHRFGFAGLFFHVQACRQSAIIYYYWTFKGGPAPLKKEINKMLGLKHEDRFSDPSFWTGTKYLFGSFLALPLQFLQGPAGHAKVPAEVPEDSQVLRVHRLCTQPPIASTPGLSPLERPGLDNITSQPWSDASCPCTTSWSARCCFVRLFVLKKTGQFNLNLHHSGFRFAFRQAFWVSSFNERAVAGPIFGPLSQWDISKSEFKNGQISKSCFVFQVIQLILLGNFFSAEEVEPQLHFMNDFSSTRFQGLLFGKEIVKTFFYQMV